MPFQMPCTNPKCGKLQSPYIDPKTDEVFCELCNMKITNITHFAKIQMKTLKQYREKKKVSFAVKCPKCSAEERPVIVNDDIFCASCQSKMDHLSETFKRMLLMQLSKADKEI